jgi:hypothetical protein
MKFEYTSNQRGGKGTAIYIVEEAEGRLSKMHLEVTSEEAVQGGGLAGILEQLGVKLP